MSLTYFVHNLVLVVVISRLQFNFGSENFFQGFAQSFAIALASKKVEKVERDFSGFYSQRESQLGSLNTNIGRDPLKGSGFSTCLTREL